MKTELSEKALEQPRCESAARIYIDGMKASRHDLSGCMVKILRRELSGQCLDRLRHTDRRQQIAEAFLKNGAVLFYYSGRKLIFNDTNHDYLVVPTTIQNGFDVTFEILPPV